MYASSGDRPTGSDAAPGASDADAYRPIVAEICELDWRRLDAPDLVNVAWAYYYFSVQFRENIEIALALYPDDAQLRALDAGERNTDNLSPWPGVALPGERINHDEFMRRTLALEAVSDSRRRRLDAIGQEYLAAVRAVDAKSRALSLASYENGGLEAVFRAFLQAPGWAGPLLAAFRHFLSEHIRLDADPLFGHGALCHHLVPDEQVVFLWRAFRQLLVAAAPRLAS